jgi:hypothetical protein
MTIFLVAVVVIVIALIILAVDTSILYPSVRVGGLITTTVSGTKPITVYFESLSTGKVYVASVGNNYYALVLLNNQDYAVRVSYSIESNGFWSSCSASQLNLFSDGGSYTWSFSC